MSATLTITVDTSAAADLLYRTRGILGAREAMHEAAVIDVSVLLRNWLIARNVRSPRNYWSEAGESVRHESDATSGRVIIGKPGVGWHRYGGTIKAKPGKALAIPLRAALKGINASEHFPNKDDAFIYRKNGKAFLASSEGKSLRIYYILLKSVSKRADPTVLPDNATISATAATAIHNLIQRAILSHSFTSRP